MRVFVAALILCVWASPTRADQASCYGRESGPHTASGERFNPEAMTAAHRTLPFGTMVQVTYAGRSVVVRITDRGPAVWTHRVIDLAMGACRRIGLVGPGHGVVELVVLGSAPYQPKHGDWGF